MQEDNREEVYRNVTKHLMDVFITPEVVRRQEAGELPNPPDLHAAQVVFYPDGRKPEIRINSEVKAIGKMKLKSGISKKYGEYVYEHELEGLEELTLTDEDDPDCGHATILKLNDNWLLAFDFRYNKALAKKYVGVANEFVEAVEFSLTRKHWYAFVDNLFSTAELSAKAILLVLWSDPHFREKAVHKTIKSKYNRFANLGNAAPHTETLNRLSDLRDPARYLKGNFSLSEDEAQALLGNVRNMLREASQLTMTN